MAYVLLTFLGTIENYLLFTLSYCGKIVFKVLFY